MWLRVVFVWVWWLVAEFCGCLFGGLFWFAGLLIGLRDLVVGLVLALNS